MIRGLIAKELRQHGILFLLMSLLICLAQLLLLSSRMLMALGGSAFTSLGYCLFILFPLLTLIQGNTLIAGEFRTKTQLFLEALPLPRWLMIAVKYVFGMVVAVGIGLLLLVLSAWRGGATEGMTTSFALLLAAKVSAWSAFCWAVCFCHGFLGRYRLMIASLVVFGLLGAQAGLGLKVTSSGPFNLIGAQFAFERGIWPTADLLITLGLIAGFSLLGFALGLVRDATLVGMLSEKMSIRERTALIMIMFTSVLAVGSVIESRENTEPLNLPGSVDYTEGSVSVSLAAAVNDPTPADIVALRNHGRSAMDLLTEAAVYLGVEDLPTLFLVHRPDFEENEYENGDTDSRQGALMRFNALKTAPDDIEFRSQILQSVFGARQHYRMELSDRRWVLLGFCEWWVGQKSEDNVAVLAKGSDIRDWLKFEEDVDEEEALEVARRCISILENANEGARQSFLRATLGKVTPHDARATFYDVMHPLESELKRTTEWDFQELGERVSLMDGEEGMR